MSEHQEPTPPARPVHTAVVQADAPIEIIVGGEDSATWFRVLDWFYDHIVPALTGAQLKVMLGMFRHRDRHTGMVARSRQQFQAELGLSKQAISETFIFLLDHPAGLLAERGSSLFEPMPGRSFAGRRADQPAAAASPPGRTGGPLQRTPVRSSGQKSAPADSEPAPYRERARASQTESGADKDQNQQPDLRSTRLSGWRGLGLFWSLDGVTDVPTALSLLDVHEPLMSQTCALVRHERPLTVPEIAEVAERIRACDLVVNKAVILCRRLFERRGLQPPARQSTRQVCPADVARLLLARQQRTSVPESRRGPSSAGAGAVPAHPPRKEFP